MMVEGVHKKIRSIDFGASLRGVAIDLRALVLPSVAAMLNLIRCTTVTIFCQFTTFALCHGSFYF